MDWINVVLILVCIGLTAVILVQPQGTGLGKAFGGTNYRSKKGIERMMFGLTIFLVVLFVALSVFNVLK